MDLLVCLVCQFHQPDYLLLLDVRHFEELEMAHIPSLPFKLVGMLLQHPTHGEAHIDMILQRDEIEPSTVPWHAEFHSLADFWKGFLDDPSQLLENRTPYSVVLGDVMITRGSIPASEIHEVVIPPFQPKRKPAYTIGAK